MKAELSPSPITEHSRFIESSPEITQKLDLLTEGIYELQTINPDIVGASLFGSTLKGEATPESDFDTSIFLDANMLEEMGIAVSEDKYGGVSIDDPELKTEYSKYLSDYLAKKMGEDSTKLEEGLFLTPISHEIIDSQIDNFLKKAEAYQDYKKSYKDWWDNNNEGPAPEPPETPIMGSNVGSLFRAELGPGLEEYRDHVLTRLGEAGQTGEEAWEAILSTVKFGEGHIDDNHYPSSLAEATETYTQQAA